MRKLIAFSMLLAMILSLSACAPKVDVETLSLEQYQAGYDAGVAAGHDAGYSEGYQAALDELAEAEPEPEPVPEPDPEPEPPPAEDLPGSRKNPAKIGETVEVNAVQYNWQGNFRITLTDIQDDASVWERIYAKNRFNDPAPEGSHYIVATFTVEFFENTASEDLPLKMNDNHFRYAGVDNSVERLPTLVFDDLNLTIYEGGSDSGELVFLVKDDETLPRALLMDAIWFDLRPAE